MAVTNIPNVQNWTVTPQNGQSGYFDLMNTWLGQSTLVIASLRSAITAQNLANAEINTLASQAENNAIIATGLANYQGEYSVSTTYSKGQSVSVAGLYYTSKVDGNSNHAVTDTNYWVANPINNKYDRGNILGAVSQTYGVPTGAIIESGSNANGTYIKFADGTMIETKSLDCAATADVKYSITCVWPASNVSGGGTSAVITGVSDTYFYGFTPPPAYNGTEFYFQATFSQTYYIILLKISRWFF